MSGTGAYSFIRWPFVDRVTRKKFIWTALSWLPDTKENNPMKHFNLALLGFGNVGRALAGLLKTKTAELRDRYGIGWKITGVASRRLGWLANPDGFDVDDLLAGNLQSPTPLRFAPGAIVSSLTIQEWLSASRADVLFENSSLNPLTGQPAIDHVKAGLEHGAHVVTANKGPVVHAYRELRDLATAKGKRFAVARSRSSR